MHASEAKHHLRNLTELDVDNLTAGRITRQALQEASRRVSGQDKPCSWGMLADELNDMLEAAKADRTPVTMEDERSYWMWRAMLEYFEDEGCVHHDEDGFTCEDDGTCITEWCLPCAAARFLDSEEV